MKSSDVKEEPVKEEPAKAEPAKAVYAKASREYMSDILDPCVCEKRGFRESDFRKVAVHAIRDFAIKIKLPFGCQDFAEAESYIKDPRTHEDAEDIDGIRKVFGDRMMRELQSELDSRVSESSRYLDSGIIEARICQNAGQITGSSNLFRERDVLFKLSSDFPDKAKKFIDQAKTLDTIRYGSFGCCLDSLLSERKIPAVKHAMCCDSVESWINDCSSGLVSRCEGDETYCREREFVPAYLCACMLFGEMRKLRDSEADDGVVHDGMFVRPVENSREVYGWHIVGASIPGILSKLEHDADFMESMVADSMQAVLLISRLPERWKTL